MGITISARNWNRDCIDDNCRMSTLGILAFGSLIDSPGSELSAVTKERLDVLTPFCVEFAHYSGARGGAATLCAVHKGGSRVAAKLLLLKDGCSLEEARNILYRREIHAVGSSRVYPSTVKNRKKAVRIRAVFGVAGIDTVLFTDFYAEGKVRCPTAATLARRAIASVAQAGDVSKNGIAYLMAVKSSGIATAIMPAFEAEILRRTQSVDLAEALKKQIALRPLYV